MGIKDEFNYSFSIRDETHERTQTYSSMPYNTSAKAAPAIATNPPAPAIDFTPAPLLVVALELLLVVEESVKFGDVTVLVLVVTPVPLTQTPLSGPAALELNVISAQL